MCVRVSVRACVRARVCMRKCELTHTHVVVPIERACPSPTCSSSSHLTPHFSQSLECCLKLQWLPSLFLCSILHKISGREVLAAHIAHIAFDAQGVSHLCVCTARHLSLTTNDLLLMLPQPVEYPIHSMGRETELNCTSRRSSPPQHWGASLLGR